MQIENIQLYVLNVLGIDKLAINNLFFIKGIKNPKWRPIMAANCCRKNVSCSNINRLKLLALS